MTLRRLLCVTLAGAVCAAPALAQTYKSVSYTHLTLPTTPYV